MFIVSDDVSRECRMILNAEIAAETGRFRLIAFTRVVQRMPESDSRRITAGHKLVAVIGVLLQLGSPEALNALLLCRLAARTGNTNLVFLFMRIEDWNALDHFPCVRIVKRRRKTLGRVQVSCLLRLYRGCQNAIRK